VAGPAVVLPGAADAGICVLTSTGQSARPEFCFNLACDARGGGATGRHDILRIRM